MAFPFPTISSNSGSLNSGSYFLQNDFDTFVDVPFQEYYFGNSEQDIVEFSVYDIEGNINIWKYIPVLTTYTVLNKTYKDVDNNTLNYNYKQYNSSYTIAFNKNILLSTLQDFSGSNINSGNHVASYNFIRNTVGDVLSGTEFTSRIEDGLEGKICGILDGFSGNAEKVISKLKSGLTV